MGTYYIGVIWNMAPYSLLKTKNQQVNPEPIPKIYTILGNQCHGKRRVKLAVYEQLPGDRTT